MSQPESNESVGRLVRQSALLLSSGAVSYVGSFTLYVVLARMLGASGFGAWVVALGLARTLSTLGLMGTDWILLRQGSYYEGQGDEPRLRRILHLAIGLAGGLLLILGVAMIAVAAPVAVGIFKDAGIAPLIRLVGVLVPIMGLGQLFLFGTQAFKQMNDYALIRNILQPVLRLGVILVAMLLGDTQTAAFVGLIVAEAILMTLALIALNRRLSLLGPTDTIETRELVRFALPVWGTKIIDTTRGQMFPLLLGSLSSFSASGAFVASQRISVAPTSIIAAMNQVYKPLGSDLYLQNKSQELSVLFKSIGKWSFAMGFPLFCLQIRFRTEILALFGEGFEDAGPALVLLAIGMLVSFGTGPVAVTLLMSGRSKLALADHIGVVTMEIILAFLLIPPYGLIGAASTRMIGNVFNNGVRLVQVYKTTGMHPYRFDYWKPVVAGLVAVFLAHGAVTVAPPPTEELTAVVAAVILGVSYTALLLVLGLSDEDRDALRSLRLRGGKNITQPSLDASSSE